MPYEGLAHADSILLGRDEANWLTLLNDFEAKKLKKIYKPESIKNLKIKTPPSKVVLPGFQLIGAIEATRGCPYSCYFCPESNTPNGNFFYKRPAHEVVEEITQDPHRIIMFYDASLTIDPNYTKQLFRLMIPLNKKFFCNGNVDVLANDEELVSLSKKAGCIGWLIGFESISQDTINTLHKTTNTIAKYKQAIDLIHSSKMMVIGDFMFGFDTDTKDVFKTTVNTILSLGIDAADFTIATPFPGTPFYNSLKNQKRIKTEDWQKYTMYSVVYEPKNMDSKELIEGIQYAYYKFYSMKSIIRRILKGTRYGFYAFWAILSRNLISMIASKKIRN
jgi:radical SAM superfamily enzyme YgiQ (UPF0313 family)